MDALDVIGAASGCAPRDFSPLHWMISAIGDHSDALDSTDLKTLAAFGLFFTASCGMSAFPLSQEQRSPDPAPRGLVCELNAQGEMIRSFGMEQMSIAWGIAIAPPSAAKQGFTPGNLFVVHESGPVRGLNEYAIAEFTPEGAFVRSFCSSRHLKNRLSGCSRILFTASGRLLVAAGNAAHEFEQGGRFTRRFAGGCSHDVCEDSEGRFYVIHASTVGCEIGVFDADGQQLRTIGGTEAGTDYRSAAVSSKGLFHVSRVRNNEAVLETFDTNGEWLGEFNLTGHNREHFVLDTADRLVMPCRRFGNVQIFSLEGKLLRRIDLRGVLSPHSVTIDAEGSLWVCGAAL